MKKTATAAMIIASYLAASACGSTSTLSRIPISAPTPTAAASKVASKASAAASAGTAHIGPAPMQPTEPTVSTANHPNPRVLVNHPCDILTPTALASLHTRIPIAGPGIEKDDHEAAGCTYNNGLTLLSITLGLSQSVAAYEAKSLQGHHVKAVPDIAGHSAARVEDHESVQPGRCVLIFDALPHVLAGIAVEVPGDSDPCSAARAAAIEVARQFG